MTSKLGRGLLIAFLLTITSAIAIWANPGPGITPSDMKEIMPLSQVKAGMKGYGLTVFKGTKIEKFDVEVIGILRKLNSGGDLILVKMSGGPITARQANIMQGMSGSPVYVNGKIIGAVAYGNAFPKEPLGMLTPIEDMLESLDPHLPSKPSGLSSVSSELDEPVRANGKTYTSVTIDPSAGASPAPNSPETLMMRPLLTPLMVSGMSGKGLAKLNEMMRPFNMTAMAGPGAGSERVKVHLQPGSAVGVSLATGDVDITGVGTLTYRRGNKIVAFGHPMLGIGATDAAMTTAYVHDVFPSVMTSNKIASPMEIVGRISQDRPFSVGGEVGNMPKMIPVTIALKDMETRRTRNLNIKVVNHPLLTPKLIALVSGQGISEMRPTPGDAMAKVTFEIDADQVGKVRHENRFFDPISIGDASTQDLQEVLMLLSSNKFYPVDVKSVKLNVEITNGHSTATVDRIFLDKAKYEPGDTARVGVVLRPYKQEPVTKYIDVTIPKYVPNGRLNLQVHGGYVSVGDMVASMVASSRSEGGVKSLPPSGGLGTAENIKQLIAKYLESDRNNELIARLVLGSAISVGGEKLSRLPGPIADIIKSAQSTGLKQERDEIKVVTPMDYLVSGSQSISLTVQKNDHAEKSTPQRPSGGVSSSGESSSSSSSSSSGMMLGDDGFGEDYMLEPSDTEQVLQSMSYGSGPGAERNVIMTIARPIPPGMPLPPRPGGQPGAPSPTSGTKPTEKFVGRGLSTWKQTSLQDFGVGTFMGTAVTTADDVRVAPALKRVASLEASFVWAAIPDGSGGAYVGTGNDGIVYRVTKDGKASVFYKTGEISVHSLARDASGALYAGTAPNGRIFRISPDGNGKMLFDADDKYILALAVGSDSAVYAGAGDSGNIYRVGSDGQGRVLTALPETQVLSLAKGAGESLYAGTGAKGVVYEIKQDGKARVLYDASQNSITSVASDGKGNVYVGTDGKGLIYRITPDGAAKTIFDKAGAPVMSMAVAKGGDIYAASGDSIYKVSDDTVYALDAGKESVQFLSVAVDGSGAIFAGTSNAGGFFMSQQNPGKAVFESAVHDTKVSSKWGPVSWSARTPEGSSVTVQTRTGNVAEPDETWSTWSGAYTSADGESISSPAGRYIQYRVNMTLGSGGASPEFKDIALSYLTANQSPTVKLVSPQSGDRWSKTQTVKWTGSDPDNDSLTYDLYYSSDRGATWKPLDRRVKSGSKAGISPSAPQKNGDKKSEPVKETSRGSALVQASTQSLAKVQADLNKHPEIPQDVKNKILAEMPDKEKESESDKKEEKSEVVEEDVEENEKDSPASPSKETSYSWDTSKIPDGTYMLKVVGSDRTSNPTGYLTAEVVSDPFVISNKEPQLFLFKRSMTVEKDRSVKLSGYTIQDGVRIQGVQYRVDDGDWMAAASDDGMYDEKSESFTVTTFPLSRGSHTIEVKTIDVAGNTATAKAQVSVP